MMGALYVRKLTLGEFTMEDLCVQRISHRWFFLIGFFYFDTQNISIKIFIDPILYIYIYIYILDL